MANHPTNQNLTLHYENTYLGLPIQVEKGPFLLEYLDRTHLTLMRALEQYPRVHAFRLDLRLPAGLIPQNLAYENEFIDRFIDSFKAKIKHNRQMARQKNPYAHDTVVRYIWAKEVGQQGQPHYHMVIFLNYDAFCSLGIFAPGRDNIFNRLQQAWASALRLPTDAAIGLVHLPENPCYYIHRNNNEEIAKFFYRASYLCKSATKVYGNGGHGFGASRT